MQLKKLIHRYSVYLPILLLGILSFFINYRYGFIGIMPMDNTVLYNGGYRVLNGYVPFTDYWLVTGPLLDYLNAFFFKIINISWSTFIIHSSLFNLFLALASYFLFLELKLSKQFSFFYSFLISVLFYPVVGTPFVDHHSTFFMILAFYSLIIAINKKREFFYLIIPFLLVLSFLSKQTPSAYGIIVIFLIIVLFCFFEKHNAKKIILYSMLGSVFSLFFLILFFYFTKINFSNFVTQYILFASSIGENRLSNYDFNVINEISNYKFLYYFIFLILMILIIKIKNFNKKDFFIILVSFALSFTLILHQMLTLNQNFIFFLIPFLCAISHFFYKKFFDRNYILIFSIIVCVFAVSKYHLRFNEYRKFNELENVDLSKAINAEYLSKSLKGLKWITYKNPENPKKELENLKQVVDILSDDDTKKTLITEYQILAPIIGSYDFSPNQWHHPSVSFPLKGQKYHETYKKFFVEYLKKNEIKMIYETSGNETAITGLMLNSECYSKKILNEMLIRFELSKDCEELR